MREVHNCGAVQTGKSLITDISIPWVMLHEPGPIMWTFQTDDDAKEHMKSRAMPLWRSCEALAALWPTERHDLLTTEIYFGPFFLMANGANPNSLQSKSIRWKFNSELWLPQWQELYKQAAARVSAFQKVGSSKIVNDSQSGNQGDVMDKCFLSGHQARWSSPCPACRKIVPLRMVQKNEAGELCGMVWADDAKRADGSLDVNRCVETVRWRCVCGHEMDDSARTRRYWNEHGAYLTENPGAPAEIRSYWWSAVQSLPMRDLAKEKAEAMNVARYGDIFDLKTYKQQRENEPWEELHSNVIIESTPGGYLYSEYEKGEKWEGEDARVMLMDRQQGYAGDVPHRWVEIRAIKKTGESRQLFFGRIDSKESCRDKQLEFGIPDRCVWQDCAFERHKVFEECAEFGWFAVLGGPVTSRWKHVQVMNGQKIEIEKPYSTIQRATALGKIVSFMMFNEDYFADILASIVSGKGVRWEVPDDVSADYEQHLRGEHKVEIRPGVWRWQKVHSTKPNHGWDTSKMAVVFAVVMKMLDAPRLPDKP